MASLLWPALFNFGPSILSGLMGHRADPQAQLRAQLQQLLQPGNQGRMTDQFYQQFLGSPAYQQALSQIAAGTNQTQNLLAQHAGAGGFSNSGTGALMSSIGPSISAGQQAGLRTAGYGGAQGQTQNTLQGLQQALYQTSGPSQTRQLFGAGLSGMSPYLQAYMRNKWPHLFAGMGQQGYGMQDGQQYIQGYPGGGYPGPLGAPTQGYGP